MGTAAWVLAAALAWSPEPGIVCRPQSPVQVKQGEDEVAEGQYRLSNYGDVVPSAEVYELRSDGAQIQARVIGQVLEYSCTAYLTQTQCPHLREALVAAQALAAMAEHEPAQAWPWKGQQAPMHYAEWRLDYGRSGASPGTANWIATSPPHPAYDLIGKIRALGTVCAPVSRSASRADARARNPSRP